MTEGAVVRGTRAVGALVVGGVLTAGLVGCTSSAQEPPGLTASPTVSATPTPEPTDDTAAEEAAILDVYYRFWAANVAVERGNPDPALYEGIATGPAVEVELAIARQYQEQAIVKEGEPSLSEVTVVVDGDTARVGACVDHSGWVPAGAPPPSPAVVPTEVVFEQVDGAWLVQDFVEPTVELPC